MYITDPRVFNYHELFKINFSCKMPTVLLLNFSTPLYVVFIVCNTKHMWRLSFQSISLRTAVVFLFRCQRTGYKTAQRFWVPEHWLRAAGAQLELRNGGGLPLAVFSTVGCSPLYEEPLFRWPFGTLVRNCVMVIVDFVPPRATA